MVLVSHLYKFIFLKNYKVAGTSVESFFGQFCIDPAEKKTYSFKEAQNEQITPYGILGSRLNVKNTKWYNHKTAKEIKTDLGDAKFNDYFKFCIVRNPYDLMVSYYFFCKSKNDSKSQGDFKTFCKKCIHINITNVDRIFIDNRPICHYYIRYENLINDILIVLEKLCIKDFDLNDLPKHKANINPHDKPYKEYYDSETKEIVEKLFKKEIDMFNYEFL
jgi:hypothetical protein